MTENDKLRQKMTAVADAKQVWLDAVEAEEESQRDYKGEFQVFWTIAMRRKALAAYRLAQKNLAAAKQTHKESLLEQD